MAHIVYDGKVYPLIKDKEQEVRERITQIIDAGTTEFVEVTFLGMYLQVAMLLVGPGISIAINNWDVEKKKV